MAQRFHSLHKGPGQLQFLLIATFDIVDEDGDLFSGPALPATLADGPDRVGVGDYLLLVDIVGKVLGRVSREN